MVTQIFFSQALENMMSASRQLYQNYANLNGSEETITEESLKNLLHDLQPKEKLPETSHDHDHGHGHEHEHTHDHEHDHETESPVEDDHDHSHDSESESPSEGEKKCILVG